MIRDRLSNKEYLTKEILLTEKWFCKRNGDILELKSDEKKGVNRYTISNLEVLDNKYTTNTRELIDKMRAMYSRGDELKDFQEVWNNAVDALGNLKKNTIGYLNLLWLVGIGILLEVPKEDMRKVEKCIKRQSTKDFVLQFLLNSYLDCEDDIELCFEKENPYKKVVEIINLSFEDKKKASDRLTKYMNSEWFKGHYDYEWKNAHKEPGYLGFWSFETAAIVKIFGLDDSKLKENNHYPYEFAHYKNEIKFNITKLNFKEEKEEEEQKQYIKSNHELEKIIPNKFREKVNFIIEDYNMLEDKEFWKKYELQDIWFEFSEYEQENADKNLLGFIIVNELINYECILQLDYKEDLEDYIDNLKSFWKEEPVKLIRFDLKNDQNYYMYIPKKVNMNNLYEVKILNI